jgi:hypothetical protein
MLGHDECSRKFSIPSKAGKSQCPIQTGKDKKAQPYDQMHFILKQKQFTNRDFVKKTFQIREEETQSTNTHLHTKSLTQHQNPRDIPGKKRMPRPTIS